MKKAELVAAIAEKTELSKKDAEKAVKAFTEVVEEELKNIRPLEMTPMEALSFLYNLKQKMEENSK